jgi:hypothetical protein
VSVSWGDFDGPRHEDELMASHEGQPTVEVQNRRNGAPAPAVDDGEDEPQKYGSSPSRC